MLPSCMPGLSRVGFLHEFQSNANTKFTALDVFRNLSTDTLAGAFVESNGFDVQCIANEHLKSRALPRIEVRSSPGKGLGLFAVDHVLAYSNILEDYALLSLAPGEDIPELWQKYLALPADDKRQFDQLGFSSHQESKEAQLVERLEARGYQHGKATQMVRVQCRFMANAFKENESDKWRATLFSTVARINHSCTPNAQTHYRPASGSKVLYAFRDILAGEEIEISYFGITMAYYDRQARAKAWGFTCTCPACPTTATADGHIYEGKLAQIRRGLDLAIKPHSLPVSTLIQQTRSAIESALDPNYPWLVAALPNLYTYLVQWLAEKNSTQQDQQAALECALEWETKITGPESPFSKYKRQHLQRFMTHPDEY